MERNREAEVETDRHEVEEEEEAAAPRVLRCEEKARLHIVVVLE